jgi:hypothetical protein
MTMHRVVDGRLVEGWLNADVLGLLQQLGVLSHPPPWSPACGFGDTIPALVRAPPDFAVFVGALPEISRDDFARTASAFDVRFSHAVGTSYWWICFVGASSPGVARPPEAS